MIEELTQQMRAAAQALEFERAALLRDQISDLQAVIDASDTRPEWEKVREQEVRQKRRVRYEV